MVENLFKQKMKKYLANLRLKIYCRFKKLAMNYFTFIVLHSADIIFNEQQILHS